MNESQREREYVIEKESFYVLIQGGNMIKNISLIGVGLLFFQTNRDFFGISGEYLAFDVATLLAHGQIQ